MILPCKYYSNQARLANSLRFLSDQPSFRFFCVRGLITRTRKEFKVLTDSVTVVVSCVMQETGKASMMLITSDDKLANRNGQDVNTEDIEKDGVYYNLCMLLQEKYKASGNPVIITLTHSEGTITITISEETEGQLRCVLATESGELALEGEDILKQFLRDCSGIRSFQYTTNTEEFKRNVAISRGHTEILKEIARYLNRTVVFVSFLSNGEMVEQYVGSSSALEVITRANGTRIYKKIAGTKIRELSPFCVYQSTARVDDILREQGRALDPGRPGGGTRPE